MQKTILALLAALLLPVLSAAGEAQTVAILRVIDGDTLRVWDGETESTVRLLGIDTPEAAANRKAQEDAAEWGVHVADILRAGEKARAFVAAVAPPGIAVTLDVDGVDVYGRTLAYVHLPDGRCLNEFLLRAGAALSPSRYRHARSGKYAELERIARAKKAGFWNTLWKNF